MSFVINNMTGGFLVFHCCLKADFKDESSPFVTLKTMS